MCDIYFSSAGGSWAEAEPGAKYYLPTYFLRRRRNQQAGQPQDRPPAGLLNLEAPAQVAAGKLLFFP